MPLTSSWPWDLVTTHDLLLKGVCWGLRLVVVQGTAGRATLGTG